MVDRDVFETCDRDDCEATTLPHEEFCPDHDPDVPASDGSTSDSPLTINGGEGDDYPPAEEQ